MAESCVSNCEDYPTAESDRRDRLSELPNSLILEILSLMEMSDVVRTTILSKRWKDLWTTVPCLHFADVGRSFICSSLAKWKGTKILEFSFSFYEDDDIDMDTSTCNMVDSWLLIPIEKQVEDLFINLRPRVPPDYSPPQRLYSCSSITKLFLANLNFKIKENVQWTNLKSLTIDQWNLREYAMNRILSGSPMLEELVLNLFEMRENLSIRSTSLKMLHIGWHEYYGSNAALRIQAPNLLTLEISASHFAHNCLLEVPSLTSAVLHLEKHVLESMFHQSSRFQMFNHVFRSICHVEKVTLSAWCTEFLVSLKEKDMVVPFSNATFLRLYTHKAEEMLDVLEMFPKLMVLIVDIDDNDKDFDYTYFGEECDSSVSKMTLSSPSLLELKTVKITWSVDDSSIIPAIKIMLENAHMLEKMVLQLGKYFTNPEKYTFAEEKLLSMSRSSPTAQVIVSKV